MKNPREPSVLAVFSVVVDDVPIDKLFVSVYYIIAQRILGSRIGAQLPELILDKKRAVCARPPFYFLLAYSLCFFLFL